MNAVKRKKMNAVELGHECQDKQSSICEADTQSKLHEESNLWALTHCFLSPWGKTFGKKM